MTEGSGLYLAGPALVKSAIGQDVGHEDLGGAKMHAAISGTIDFREADDDAGLARVRALAESLPLDPKATAVSPQSGQCSGTPAGRDLSESSPPSGRRPTKSAT